MTPETISVYRSLEACGEDNACGVAALAIMTGHPVQVVRQALARCGRRPGDGSRGDIFFNAACLLGLTVVPVSAREAIRLAMTGRKVFLHTHDHIFAAEGGRLHDPVPGDYLHYLNGGIAVLD